MFKSIHSQRWFKWVTSPKKYIINLEVKVGDRYTFRDVEVTARTRHEAIQKAKKETLENIKLIVKGSKSFGRVKQLNEF